jgi:hypothetical protein
MTDEEAIEQLSFNIQWHYALNITEESDEAKYISTKTLWTMRDFVYQNGLDEILFKNITGKLAKVFQVNTDNQRIDSVHIKSNMRRLGRISIFVTSINKFLVNLKRNHKALFDTVASDVVEKYLPEKSLKCFAMIKPSASAKTLTSVSADLFDLVQQFKSHSKVKNMHSYKLLERVLNEQCNLNVSDSTNPVTVKPPKQIPSDSLQNPSDPDAAYSGHKGQGYQVQVMETYSKEEDPKRKKKDLNLITHVDVEPANQSDANAIILAIESATKSNIAPKELLADSLYDSDDNHHDAAKQGVEVVAPVMGNYKEGTIGLEAFKLSDKGKVLSCPQGHAPAKTRKKKRFSAGFDLQHCSNCPNQSICSVKKGKKYYYLRYTAKQMRVAIRRAYEQTDAFKDRYRWRAGVEATMSELDRRTGVKRLRVRGFKAVRFCAILKATGLNILRAVAVRRARIEDESAQDSSKRGALYAFLIIKERAKQVLAFVIQINHIKYVCIQ